MSRLSLFPPSARRESKGLSAAFAYAAPALAETEAERTKVLRFEVDLESSNRRRLWALLSLQTSRQATASYLAPMST